MTLTLFILSVVFLGLFIFYKVWEDMKDKKLIPVKIMDKSDDFIETNISRLIFYYNKITEKALKIQPTFKRIVIGLIEHAGEHKDLLKKKINKSLDSNKKIKTPKTSVFLRNIEKQDIEN